MDIEFREVTVATVLHPIVEARPPGWRRGTLPGEDRGDVRQEVHRHRRRVQALRWPWPWLPRPRGDRASLLLSFPTVDIGGAKKPGMMRIPVK